MAAIRARATTARSAARSSAALCRAGRTAALERLHWSSPERNVWTCSTHRRTNASGFLLPSHRGRAAAEDGPRRIRAVMAKRTVGEGPRARRCYSPSTIGTEVRRTSAALRRKRMPREATARLRGRGAQDTSPERRTPSFHRIQEQSRGAGGWVRSTRANEIPCEYAQSSFGTLRGHRLTGVRKCKGWLGSLRA
jgi:hypothetical protein